MPEPSERRLRALVITQALSLIGGNVHSAALGWLLLQTMGARGFAVFIVARFAPGAAASLLFGSRLDRVDRRRAVVAVYTGQFVIGTVFAISWAAGQPPLALIVVYLCIYSSLASLDAMAFSSLLSITATPAAAKEWVATMTLWARAASVVALAVAGPLVAWSPVAVLAFNAFSFVPVSAAAVVYGASGCTAARCAASSTGWRDAAVELIATLGRRRSTMVALFTCFVALPSVLTPLAAVHTGWGPWGLTVVGVSMTATSLCVTAAYRRRETPHARGLAAYCLVAAVGLCLMPVGHVGTVAGVVLFTAAMSIVLLSGSRAAASTPEHLRARAVGLWAMASNSSTAVAGPVALGFLSLGSAGPFMWCALCAVAAAAGAAAAR